MLAVRALFLFTAAAMLTLAGQAGADDPKPASSDDASTRTPSVHLIVSPGRTPTSPWRMVVVNRESQPVRIVADATRLSFLIRGPADKKYATCSIPTSMQSSPVARQLVLQPGELYAEDFDLRLFCWGDAADRLIAGASTTAFLGWSPGKPKRYGKPKPPSPPFAVEATVPPAAFADQKRLASLTTWLNADAFTSSKPSPDEDKPTVLGAPDLRLRTPRWVDASNVRDARLTATLTNVGDRTATVHLRPDDLEVTVFKPDGQTAVCPAGPSMRASARDFFQTIKPGKSSSVVYLIAEMCPRDTFERPGIYELRATLRVRDDGATYGLHALTGNFPVKQSTLLRIRSAREPYHAAPPRAGK